MVMALGEKLHAMCKLKLTFNNTVPSFFGPLVGMWVDQSGPRIPAVLCFALSTPFVILLRLIDHNTSAQKAGLCGLLFGLGVAVSLALPAILAEMRYVYPVHLNDIDYAHCFTSYRGHLVIGRLMCLNTATSSYS